MDRSGARFSRWGAGATLPTAAHLAPERGLSMALWKNLAVLGTAGSLMASGCARAESCERGRMNLDRMWDAVQTEAARLQLSSAESVSTHTGNCKVIEPHIDLLQSSFATEQITWA